MKKALITGITGQDGSFLAEYLLGLGYEVSGLIRRNSFSDYGNVSHLQKNIRFFYGDVTDAVSVERAVAEIRPDEVYNLAAQSFVSLSWSQPDYTSRVNGLGVLNILEAVKKYCPQAAFYQASTSELFGLTQQMPQNEKTPFHPRSPYGVAKLYAHWLTGNYRESYGMFCCAGILFNHESERRKKEFVTRKITAGVADIVKGNAECLHLGCLDAKRDWGYAGDYVKAMHAMVSKRELLPDDYVIATGKTHTVREFAETAFKCVGINLDWVGQGIDEKGINRADGKTLVDVEERFFRPAEVMLLLGDATKAHTVLGWQPQVGFEELVSRMVDFDINNT